MKIERKMRERGERERKRLINAYEIYRIFARNLYTSNELINFHSQIESI